MTKIAERNPEERNTEERNTEVRNTELDETNQWDAAPEADEELYLMMSLALDGMLDDQEIDSLESSLAADPALVETWQQWGKMDAIFSAAPYALPAVGFTNRFEAALEKKVAKERTRQRVVFAITATVVWVVILAIAAVALAFIATNQGTLMSAFVRELAWYSRAFTVAMQAMRTTFTVTFGEPQTLAIASMYAVATGVLMYVWVRILRRTTREEAVS